MLESTKSYFKNWNGCAGTYYKGKMAKTYCWSKKQIAEQHVDCAHIHIWKRKKKTFGFMNIYTGKTLKKYFGS